MTSELANSTPTADLAAAQQAPEITPAFLSGDVDLQAWAGQMTAAAQLGTALCKTPFVPKDFQGKPEAAAAAILAGKSLGMDPLAALTNIFVVHGRPGLYARTMHALVMSHGHEVIRTQASPKEVTVQARRKGSSEWQDFTWTIERAEQAGYVKTNPKYKDNPIEMLTAKALAEACRVIAPDVLTGIADLSVEDVEDMGERPARPSRVPQAQPAPSEAEGAAERITAEDWAQAQAAAAERGMDGAGLGQFVSDTLGRHIAGPGQILKAELQVIIDGLRQAGEGE